MSSAGRIQYLAVIEKALEKTTIAHGPDTLLSGYSQLPKHIDTLLFAHWAYSECMNGGVYQFFTNDTGQFAPEAVAALRAIDLPDAAAALEEAMSHLGTPYPRDFRVRERAYALVPTEVLAACDRRFSESCAGFEAAADAFALRFR